MSLFDRGATVLKYLVLVGAALYIALYITLAILRIPYPYELEWMEGSSVDHVQRVLEGKSLYVAPSVEFVPMIYPPLYYYVSAGVAKFTGIGFTPLRLVSFFASLGCLLLIFLWVRRETQSWQAALLAAGLFAASYRIGGAWLDIARVDSLFLLFLLAAAYSIRFYDTLTSYVVAGVLLALSFLTKQVALVAAVPLIVRVLFRERRNASSAILLGGTFVVIAAGVTLILNSVSEGWYSYYVFDVASSHPIVQTHWLRFWSRDILLPMAIACLLALFFVFIRLIQQRKDHVWFYSLFAAGMLGASWLSRLKAGGYDNCLIPAYAALAILLGVAVPVALKFHDEKLHEELEKTLARSFLYAALMIQFLVLSYNPLNQIPTQADRAAGDSLIRKMASVNGNVFLPFHGYLSSLAGKKSHAHVMAIHDVLISTNDKGKAILQADIAQALQERRFAAILLDVEHPEEIPLEQDYAMQEKIFERAEVFRPVTGWITRPEFVYKPWM